MKRENTPFFIQGLSYWTHLGHKVAGGFHFKIKFVIFFAIFTLQRFLQRFIDLTSTEDENAGLDLNEPLYMQKLEEVQISFFLGNLDVYGTC